MEKQQQSAPAVRGQGILEWYEALISAALVLVLIFSFFFRIIQVDGRSMVPTLTHGDKLIVWAAAFIIGGYDGYYGPGTGTFLMIIFVRFAKLDTRHAAGGVKVINLASNFGSLFTALRAGYVLVGVGLISAVASILGHYLGAGLAIKNGSKIVKPTVILVLLLLMVKVGSELLFPEFWN